MNKYIVEFIGTFFLALIIGCAVLSGLAVAPLAIGTGLIALVYMGGHISGAHYNPGVTLALWLRGKCETKDVLPYLIAEFAGACAAAACAIFLYGQGSPMEFKSIPAGLVAEFLFTFALVFVILNVATARGMAGNPNYGIAIGLIVMAGAFCVGTVSGAAFNPAVSLALGIMSLVAWTDIWIQIVGALAGAVAAVYVFKLVLPEDNKKG